MKKYETYAEIFEDYSNNKITYNEYVEELCILYVGINRFDFYDLAEHDLYIYCTDGTVETIENFY